MCEIRFKLKRLIPIYEKTDADRIKKLEHRLQKVSKKIRILEVKMSKFESGSWDRKYINIKDKLYYLYNERNNLERDLEGLGYNFL